MKADIIPASFKKKTDLYMGKPKEIRSYNSYIFVPYTNCSITVYGSPNEKSCAIDYGQKQSVAFTFSKDTCNLLENYIKDLQAMLT